MAKTSLTVYHGTCWEIPLLPTKEAVGEATFSEFLDPEAFDLGAAFVTNQSQVAEFFAGTKQDAPDTHMQVMLVGRLQAHRVMECNFNIGAPEVTIEDETYRIPGDRPELHTHLRQLGFDAFIMRGDYKFDGIDADDIAILDPHCYVTTGVKLCQDGHWSPTMPVETGRQIFLAWAARSAGYHFDLENEEAVAAPRRGFSPEMDL